MECGSNLFLGTLAHCCANPDAAVSRLGIRSDASIDSTGVKNLTRAGIEHGTLRMSVPAGT